MTTQLPLFRADAEALRGLREDLGGLAAAHAALFAQYEALWMTYHTLQGKVARLKKDLAGKKKYMQQQRQRYLDLLAVRLADAEHPLCLENAELRRELAGLRDELRKKFEAFWGRRLGPASPSKADLTRLLTLCHPDKWSAGQPATELAHELTVVLNAARAQEGQR